MTSTVASSILHSLNPAQLKGMLYIPSEGLKLLTYYSPINSSPAFSNSTASDPCWAR